MDVSFAKRFLNTLLDWSYGETYEIVIQYSVSLSDWELSCAICGITYNNNRTTDEFVIVVGDTVRSSDYL